MALIIKQGIKIKNNILDFFLPHYCLNCRVNVDNYGMCPECFSKLDFINHDHACKICSLDLGSSLGNEEKICGKCLLSPPAFDQNISIFKYQNLAKDLVVSYKLADKDFLTDFFVKLAKIKLAPIIDQIDIITTVPMHWYKLLWRNYNPPELLALELAKIFSKKYLPDILIKSKYTKPQLSLTRKQRLVNLKSSITYNQKYDFKDKSILLIDDVITTGTTLGECSMVLKKQNIKKVFCLSLAKN